MSPVNSLGYEFDVKYKLLVSLDKKMMKYYNRCGSFFASSFYPEHITRANFDRVFTVYTLTGKEIDTDGWINILQKVTGFTTYYTSVFAELKAKSAVSNGTGSVASLEDLRVQSHNYSMFKRIHYRLLKYTTSDFAWPLELVTAVAGFTMLILVSIYLLKKSGPGWIKHVSGFSQIAHDISDALERNFEEMKKKDEDLFSVNTPSIVGTGGYEVEVDTPKTKVKKNRSKVTETLDKSLEETIEEQIARSSKLFPGLKNPEPSPV